MAPSSLQFIGEGGPKSQRTEWGVYGLLEQQIKGILYVIPFTWQLIFN